MKFEFPQYVSEVLNTLKIDSEVVSIWFVGSRANGTHKIESDWDFVAFTNKKTIKPVPGKNDNVDVIRVSLDGNALLEGQKMNLEHKFSMWEWSEISGTEAMYVGKKFAEYPKGYRDIDEPVYLKAACKSYLIWSRAS